MIRLYATFNGLRDIKPDETSIFDGKLQMVWTNVRDDTGDDLGGDYFSNRAKIFHNLKLRKGDRFVIDFKELKHHRLLYPIKVRKTKKNPTCGMIRKAFDDYTFIKGKFKGKWVSKMTILELDELKRYLTQYIAPKTDNEATIRNVLKILEIIDEQV